MSKKILVLAGSPRQNGNSDILAHEFCKAAQEEGHIVDTFRVADHKINGCVACDRCWSKDESPCVQNDEMVKLFPLLEAADMIVLVTPLYYFGFPSQIKAVIDRFYPYSKDQKLRGIDGKECAMIVCGGSDDENSFEAVMETYDMLTDYLEWEDLGVIPATALFEKGTATHSEWMEAARDLAMNL
ncbi:flavodoxin family protein [Oscillospiraceae bacterium PP1C4]